jgi:hypothetical protein
VRSALVVAISILLLRNANAADFAGTWKLNLTKSKTSRSLPSGTYKIEPKEPDTYRTTIESVTQSGQHELTMVDRTCDGEERPARMVDLTLKAEYIPTPGLAADSDDVDQSFRSDGDQRGAKRREAFSV